MTTMYVRVERVKGELWNCRFNRTTDYTLDGIYRGLNYIDTTEEGAFIGLSRLVRYHAVAGFIGRIEVVAR